MFPIYFCCSKKHARSEPPIFLKKIGDCDIYPGMDAKFTAMATGYPRPEVEWFKNGQKLFPTDKIHIETESNGLMRLCIKNADEADVGRYTCRVFNPHGDEQCEAELLFDSKFGLGSNVRNVSYIFFLFSHR